MRQLLIGLSALCLSTFTSAQGLVDLTYSPALASAAVGDVIEIQLLASAAGSAPANIGSLDALIQYDASALTLIGSDQTAATYSWFIMGFLPDPDGINADIGDGEALFSALAQPTLPATTVAPGSLTITTLRFQAIAPSPGAIISIGAMAGAFGDTMVTDFFVAGLDITGDFSSTTTISIGGPISSYCAGSTAACPCGNAGGAGEGCGNSTGVGALLGASGSVSVSANDLALSATSLPLSQSGILYMGPNQIQSPFGDGLRCVGGGALGIVRFPVTNSGPSGTIPLGPGFLTGTPITSGSTWNFQAWYRDPQGPCGNAFNLSNALSVTFAP
jgi:hypothetical protein